VLTRLEARQQDSSPENRTLTCLEARQQASWPQQAWGPGPGKAWPGLVALR